jgi:general secretion pathway protein E
LRRKQQQIVLKTRQLVTIFVIAAAIFALRSSSFAAETTIKLTSGATISGEVMSVDNAGVMLRLTNGVVKLNWHAIAPAEHKQLGRPEPKPRPPPPELTGEPTPTETAATAEVATEPPSEPTRVVSAERIEPEKPQLAVAETEVEKPKREFVRIESAWNWRYEIGFFTTLVVILAWLRVLVWVNRDAQRMGMSSKWWNTAALLLFVPGVLAYFVARHRQNRRILAAMKTVRPESDNAPIPMKTETPPSPAAPVFVMEQTDDAGFPDAKLADGLEILDAHGEPIGGASGVPPLVTNILAKAVEMAASDIHLEPTSKNVQLRMRVDGAFRVNKRLSLETGMRVIKSIKALASIDVAQKSKALDGRFRARGGDVEVDFRVACSGAMHGEALAVRLLHRGAKYLDLNQLGMSEETRTQFEALIQSKSGMIVLAGPAGSGKTTTAYAALARLDPREKKIVTVEDPVEYELAGATQIPVNPKAGVTFESALQSLLRQDCDVILVGELRSAESAELALNASIAGNFVLSTVHASGAAGGVLRLGDFGLKPMQISSAVLGSVGQRLVRALCRHCRQKYTPSAQELQMFTDGLEPPTELCQANPAGCRHCYCGYAGRTGVFELLVMASALKALLNEGATEEQLTDAAMQHGFLPLWVDGLRKVRDGVITLREFETILR